MGSNLYRIGSTWLFDPELKLGYAAVRHKGTVSGMLEAYTIDRVGDKKYRRNCALSVPIGIIRKSVDIAERSGV